MPTYSETLEYLFEQLPMFQNVGKIAFKKDLKNIISLCKLLGNPQLKFKSIHIAGTNGKGSTSHMLASILQENGYKTGLYTSPHLKDFRERIRINGVEISENEVIDFVLKYKTDIEEIKPSFFEITVALAFNYFANEKVDFAIIETGLGGRLDSTNIITPILSVITNISFDHMDILGDTLPEIANEKAGIIKSNVPIIIGNSDAILDNIFIQQANEKRCRIRFADKVFSAKLIAKNAENQILEITKNSKLLIPELEIDLLGDYQLQNSCTVLAVIDELNNIGVYIDDDIAIKALGGVKKTTHLLGRWDVLQSNPLVIAETAHNEKGLFLAVNQIYNLLKENGILRVVFGVVKDKQIDKLLAILPKNAQYYFTQANIPRALPVSELKVKCLEFGLNGNTFQNVRIAKNTAINDSNPSDIVLITGSIFVVAEAL